MGDLVELSTQQMTSCTPNPLTCGGTGGCQGSTPPLGYNYVQLFGQISESDYPYVSGSTSQSESCQYDLSSLTPVAASSWSSYGGGIYNGCDYDNNIRLDHGVQL